MEKGKEEEKEKELELELEDLQTEHKIQLEYFKKKHVVDFFKYRSYKLLTSHFEVAESDFVESMMKMESFYRKQGTMAGIFMIFSTWDTILKKYSASSKFFFGIVLIKATSELFAYRHINEFYDPLYYIYEKYYMPLIKES